MKWHLSSAAEFHCCHQIWDDLNRRGTYTPLLDSRFWQQLLDAFGSGDELVAVCEDGSGHCAAALVTRSGTRSWQTFQPAQAPIGAWLQTGDGPPEALMQSLLATLPGMSPVFGVLQQDPTINPRPEPKDALQTMDYIRTARVTLNGSFEDYWSKRGKNLKQNMRRQRNRLQREETVIDFETLTLPVDVVRGVDEYSALESQGWKSERGTALSPDNTQGRFYRKLLRTYAERGEACVYQYRYNGTLVACDLALLRHGVMYLLKTTHDEKQKNSSPASLMRESLFQQYCDDKTVHTVEFYGRVMEWHTRWTDEIRSLYHADVSRWVWLQRLRSRRRRHMEEVENSTASSAVG